MHAGEVTSGRYAAPVMEVMVMEVMEVIDEHH
jgi:hypothetical protein